MNIREKVAKTIKEIHAKKTPAETKSRLKAELREDLRGMAWREALAFTPEGRLIVKQAKAWIKTTLAEGGETDAVSAEKREKARNP